ncbi:hypothetical protein GCM10028803_07300 [Larkinella knui]|uniref:Uncharacterized protein n=1 Tax=Larkinella knui TaxID=2025310 RepID=A0A3P1CKJ5_9BACT|nr:hypothetical protein [Larkinella knui]RRB13596.1 hypothetical protein EHT87_15150 [Larkinella knui]
MTNRRVTYFIHLLDERKPLSDSEKKEIADYLEPYVSDLQREHVLHGGSVYYAVHLLEAVWQQENERKHWLARQFNEYVTAFQELLRKYKT